MILMFNFFVNCLLMLNASVCVKQIVHIFNFFTQVGTHYFKCLLGPIILPLILDDLKSTDFPIVWNQLFGGIDEESPTAVQILFFWAFTERA